MSVIKLTGQIAGRAFTDSSASKCTAQVALTQGSDKRDAKVNLFQQKYAPPHPLIVSALDGGGKLHDPAALTPGVS